ncbi:MAG: hypothetical protein GDA56_02475 [Hormoscilla sp. GM7CHS1pb]|nr:hypothetical protein [Hormoscilla sp. GM7CHS1pb]
MTDRTERKGVSQEGIKNATEILSLDATGGDRGPLGAVGRAIGHRICSVSASIFHRCRFFENC